MRDLVSHTYNVSKQYAEDKPDLSMTYNPERHRLDVTIQEDEINIPLKYNRFNEHATFELLDEAKQTAMTTYPIKGGVSARDNDIIEQTHALCMKHIDFNRESPTDEAFFTFDAGNGVFDSTIQTHAESMTVVDAHCDRYGHLNESTRLAYIQEEITDHLDQMNTALDSKLAHVAKDPSNQTDVSLRDCIAQQNENENEDEPVMLSFDGLTDLDQSQEM